MKTRALRTRVIIEANIIGFKELNIPRLRHIPAKGEAFHFDKRIYPAQAARIALEEEFTGEVCHVINVEHHLSSRTHYVILTIGCQED